MWGKQRIPGLARSRLRRLLSLRSRMRNRRARFTSRGDPGLRKPRGVEVTQVTPARRAAAFAETWRGRARLPPHLTHWRLSLPRSCRVHRPGHPLVLAPAGVNSLGTSGLTRPFGLARDGMAARSGLLLVGPQNTRCVNPPVGAALRLASVQGT